MKKILMIVPSPFFSDRGCHVRVYEENKALTRKGFDVLVATYHFGRNPGGIKIIRTPKIPWYKKEEPGPSFHKLYLDLFLLIISAVQMFKYKPDIIHAHLHEGALIGKILKFIFRKPLVFDFQGSLTGELEDHNVIKNGKILSRFIYSIEKGINSFPNVILTSSINSYNLLVDKFMVDKKKIIHVPDGIDGVFTVETNKVIEIKKRLKIKEDKKIIVYLGTLNRLEGTDILLEVARRILLCRKDLIFMIMGYPNVEFYKNRAEQLGIQENVIFTGKINYDEALNYLSLGILAISPKISETEGNGKLLLYMLAGLPAVVFDTWANREILGPYGIYCQFGSVDDMVEKLNKHIDTGQNIKFEMKTKLTERVKTKFNWDDIVRKIIYSYELAASKPKG